MKKIGQKVVRKVLQIKHFQNVHDRNESAKGLVRFNFKYGCWITHESYCFAVKKNYFQ